MRFVNYIKRVLVLPAVLLVTSQTFGQSQYFINQFSVHKPFMNPAAIINNSDINAAMLYRKQWVGFSGTPSTSLLDANMRFRNSNSHFGVTVTGDFIGINQELTASLNYAYRVKIDRYKTLGLAFAPTLVTKQSDFNSVSLDYDIDPLFQQPTPNVIMPNVKFGAFYTEPRFYIGIASLGLLHNNIEIGTAASGKTSFDFNYIHYNIMGGYNFELANKWKLEPAALIKHVPGAPIQFDAVFRMSYLDKYGGGIAYSSSNTINFMVNFEINQSFRLAYCYSYSLSAIQNYTSGSQEIMLLFGMWNRRKSYINMPKLIEDYKTSNPLPAAPTRRQPYSGN